MNLPEDTRPQRPASASTRLHQRRSLQEANEFSLQLSGNQLQHSSDPQGQRLRTIRKAQGLNPSEVATQACISLGQLYELETGGDRLFYSATLRQQAGRRVAQLLGTDWDQLAEEDPRPGPAAPPAPALAMDGQSGQTSQRAGLGADDTRENPKDQEPADLAGPSPGDAAEPLSAGSTQGRGLRTLVWVLGVVALGLAAGRLGWIPGLQLPLQLPL